MKLPKPSEMSTRMLAAATAGALVAAFGSFVFAWWTAHVLAWWAYGLVWTGEIVGIEVVKIALRLRRQRRRMAAAMDGLVALLKGGGGEAAP